MPPAVPSLLLIDALIKKFINCEDDECYLQRVVVAGVVCSCEEGEGQAEAGGRAVGVAGDLPSCNHSICKLFALRHQDIVSCLSTYVAGSAEGVGARGGGGGGSPSPPPAILSEITSIMYLFKHQ